MINFPDLSETAQQYIGSYHQRLAQFMNEVEASEIDFIDRELYTIANVMDAQESLKTTGDPTVDLKHDYSGAYHHALYAVEKIGHDRFHYSNKRKVEFLNERRKALLKHGIGGRPYTIHMLILGTIDFSESPESYIDNYGQRAAQFMENCGVSEINFIMLQSASIGDPMRDYELCKHYPNPLEHDFRGGDGLTNVVNAVKKLGYGQYFEWNKRKIDFLKQRAAQIAGIQVAPPRDDSISQDDDSILTAIKSMTAKAIVPGELMDSIVDHFLPLTETRDDNRDPFLTKGQLSAFLKRGFLKDQTQPKQKINCPNGKKGFVIKRFYEFYKKAKNDYNIPDRKEPFISLFMDCFNNWDRGTVESLFRGNKARGNW